jgi:hypothetical protein
MWYWNNQIIVNPNIFFWKCHEIIFKIKCYVSTHWHIIPMHLGVSKGSHLYLRQSLSVSHKKTPSESHEKTSVKNIKKYLNNRKWNILYKIKKEPWKKKLHKSTYGQLQRWIWKYKWS